MRRIALAALMVLMAAPASATAAATLVSPVSGRTAGSFPLLRWTLPAGEENEVVYIASSAARVVTGEFRVDNLEDTTPMSGRASSHRTTNGLYAGTHYWLVGTRTANFEQRYSKVGRFRVASVLAVSRLRVTPDAAAGTADLVMRVKTNAHRLRFAVQVLQDGRVVQTFGRTTPIRNPGFGGSRRVSWVPSSAVATRRATTLRVTIRAGLLVAHVTVRVTAP